MIFAQVLDVVGEDGVEVTDAVGPGEVEISAVVFVEQGDAFAEMAVFGEPVAEVVGQGATEPGAELRAGLGVERSERRGEGLGGGFQSCSFVRFQFSKCERWQQDSWSVSGDPKTSAPCFLGSARRAAAARCVKVPLMRQFLAQ